MVGENNLFNITILVAVQVDAGDKGLAEPLEQVGGPFSLTDVVCCEIQSNLESLSYVREVRLTPIERR
jgi:hypothetical protein